MFYAGLPSFICTDIAAIKRALSVRKRSGSKKPSGSARRFLFRIGYSKQFYNATSQTPPTHASSFLMSSSLVFSYVMIFE